MRRNMELWTPIKDQCPKKMINYDIKNKFTIYEIMSGHIETEMTDCLEQMARLQAKMEVLQQEKNNKAAEELVKRQEVEPNLRIMSEWLDKYGEILEENERERAIEEQYRKLETQRDNGLENKIIKYKKIVKVGHSTQACIDFKPTSEEYELYKNKDLITEKYMNLQNERRVREKTKYYGNNGKIVSVQQQKYEKIRNSPFHNPIGNTPTYFMKQYIEATHNLFVIQQKKIDELEQKIEEILQQTRH